MNRSRPYLELIVSGKEKQLSKEARYDFAYLLGVFQLCHGDSNRWQRSFNRMIKDERVLNNLIGIAERLGTRKPTIRGRRFEIYDRRLMKALLGGLKEERFDLLIANDKERVAFLQGYFDQSRMTPREDKCIVEYRTSCLDPNNRKRLLETFFELGIYPSPRRNYIGISHFPNIHRLYSLNLDQDEENREVVRNLLEKNKNRDPHSLQKYYAIRRASQRLFEKGEQFSQGQLGREMGVPRSVVYSWTADIARKHGRTFQREEQPSIVPCYERLLAKLKMPNPYLIEEPTRRKEKILLPADYHVYCLPPEAQADYLAILKEGPAELDDGDLRHLQSQLELNLNGSKDRELDISFDETRTILSVVELTGRDDGFKEVCLVVGGQRYFLPPKMQKKYCRIYGVELEPINEDDIGLLQGQLGAYLDKKLPRDLNFRIDEHRNITNIFSRTGV